MTPVCLYTNKASETHMPQELYQVDNHTIQVAEKHRYHMYLEEYQVDKDTSLLIMNQVDSDTNKVAEIPMYHLVDHINQVAEKHQYHMYLYQVVQDTNLLLEKVIMNQLHQSTRQVLEMHIHQD
jgi:hypothetical protein